MISDTKLVNDLFDLMKKWSDLSTPTQVMLARFWCNLFPLNDCGNIQTSRFILENEKLFSQLLEMIRFAMKSESNMLQLTCAALACNLAFSIENDTGDNECQLAVTIIESLKLSKFSEETFDYLVEGLHHLTRFKSFMELVPILELNVSKIPSKKKGEIVNLFQ